MTEIGSNVNPAQCECNLRNDGFVYCSTHSVAFEMKEVLERIVCHYDEMISRIMARQILEKIETLKEEK